MACPAMQPDAPFLSSALTYLDCQAQAIGSGGYTALSAAGSPAAVLLTGLLTIFVALFGYRMLVGQVPALRDGVVAFVKIGVVLALATSWPAYRTLVYDVTLLAPAELGAQIGQSAGLPGAGGGLIPWLQAGDDSFRLLAFLGPEAPVRFDPVTQTQTQIQPVRPGGLPAPRPNPGFDALMLNLARILYLIGAVAALASVRLIAGVLLALGPIFAIFLLFDGTRGLFEGWVRGLAGAALGALGAAMVLGVELAFVEPWLLGLIAEREAGLSITGVPVELFVVAFVFALALLAMLIAAARLAYGFRLPAAWSGWARLAPAERPAITAPVDRVTARDPAASVDNRGRAHALADAVRATQRRETAAVQTSAAILQRSAPAPAGPRDPALSVPVPIGQSYRRRTQGRMSAGAGRRDGIR